MSWSWAESRGGPDEVVNRGSAKLCPRLAADMELLPVPVHKISALRNAGPLHCSGTSISTRPVPVGQCSGSGSLLYLQ